MGCITVSKCPAVERFLITWENRKASLRVNKQQLRIKNACDVPWTLGLRFLSRTFFSS